MSRSTSGVTTTTSPRRRLYYTSGDDFEVHAYRLDGTLELLIRRSGARRPVTPRLIADYRRRHRYSRVRVPGGRVESYLDGMQYPERLPACGRMLLDRAGALWVQEYPLYRTPPTSNGLCSIPGGTWLTNVAVPVGYELMDIGSDYVLVLVRDEMDVEIIRRYVLTGRI